MERIRDLLPDTFDSTQVETTEVETTAARDTQSATTTNSGIADSLSSPSMTNSEHAASSETNSKDLEIETVEPSSAEAAKKLWQQICGQLEKHLNPQIFAAWLQPLVPVLYHSDDQRSELVLQVPNKFSAQHIQKNYIELLRAVATQFTGVQIALRLSVPMDSMVETSSVEKNARSNDPMRNSTQSATGTQSKTTNGNARRSQNSSKPRLVSREARADTSNLITHYNFSNFVVGGCNQFAHAVSLQVSENLGSTYNPLFIYGGVGLGKTHLANAIGNASRRRSKKVLLVSSETFVSELITSLRSNAMQRFKDRFRSLDLLIIDDIQFIIGKERTQEEFFHTFNELYNRNKQIIVTCDKVPQELIGLEDRLRTRFACGVSADLQQPDYETRVAILIKKAQTKNIELDDAVARVLAERIDTNVRELEGALNRLIAMATLQQRACTIDLANEVLQTISPSQRIEVTADRIQKVVAERFNVSISDLLGKRRTHNIAFARQVAMYLCREHTGCSYPELGALFGGRDHSTVIHARKVISEKVKSDPDFQKDLGQIQQNLNG